MNEAANVRSEILQFIRRELIGPDPRPEHIPLNEGDEILRPQDPPRLRYAAGVLFPSKCHHEHAESATQDEASSDDSEIPEGGDVESVISSTDSTDMEDVYEHEVNRANEYLPSAMGITALVRLPDHLKVVVKAGRYEKKAQVDLGKPDKDGHWQPHHWRHLINPAPVDIDCSDLLLNRPVVKKYPLETGDENLQLILHIYSRTYAKAQDPECDRIITFTLINRTPMSGNSPKDSECLFQCEFSVENPVGNDCFLEYPEQAAMEQDVEEQSLRMLYRHRKTYAVGHGCSADWPFGDGSAVTRIWTESLPYHEVKPILPRQIPGLKLSMIQLSEVGDPEAIDVCTRLADKYLEWIEAQSALIEAPDFPQEYFEAAQRHMQLCHKCHRRIVDGVELLRVDPGVRQAFAWMNRAMLLQQLHYDLAANHRREWVTRTKASQPELKDAYQAPDVNNPPEDKGNWRPFQLAFILMNLRAISRADSLERAIVDLIWFPTGGGKTEAYLGLTAFTIFERRLHNPQDAGTTVLMRYTLRLLTTQQFQRAAALICACEVIRRDNETRLGNERISIGLWVGQDVTPNDHRKAVSSVNTLQREGKPNPFVVLTCPWCGAEMGPVKYGNAFQAKGYRKEGTRIVFRCEDPQCDFRDARGLPLLVVDESIYQERPTLLIGTVDKFAMLPWNSEARRLFGLDDLKPVSPPDLIIQDELHLISGALGSMVGLYESTIDALCQREVNGVHRPAKIVASTATICHASDQVHALYARDVFLFPPQGLQAGDSFFAEERTQSPGRLYVGVFGSALSSHVTAQVRVMATLLQAVNCVSTMAAAVIDPYWTLLAYFNSLRELGHAATLIRADIREYLNAVWDRLGIRKPQDGNQSPDRRRFIDRDMELTSRIQSSQVTEVLQRLFEPCRDQYDDKGRRSQQAVDVCLATNMIQVGLDVPRLGLMTIVGQPKTTSEYIQATSRVGRTERGPGLVVTVYNPAKPRDRSHYEHFRSYHQSIYRWVEPTSVTPFAVPVRDRALHAQVITLARYWGSLSIRGRPNPPPDEQLIRKIREVLIQRIREVDPDESDLSSEMLDDFIQQWLRILPSIYGHFGLPPQETPLMYPSGTEPRQIWAGRAKATPSSMRNVDAGCNAKVILQFPKS